MFQVFAICISLVILVCCTYIKYDRSKKHIPSSAGRKKYGFFNSTEFQDTIIQVAIVFLGAFLAMSITERMDHKAEYDKAKSMMEALNFSHTNKFAQIYGEIYDLEVQNDMEKKLDVVANSISTSSSLIERECFMNDYVISTLSPGSTMQISGSYENIDRCVRKLEIVESKKEKAELIADYCYYSCVLGFEYELLKKEPYLDLVLFAISEDASVFWEKSAYCKMYSHCIDKLEESFSVDLEEWREKSPYSANTD